MAKTVDKSRQGSVDADIAPLLDLLNSKGYETTSSCSGRIVLLKIPSAGDKKNAEWLYKTHETARADELVAVLRKSGAECYLLQEPVIVHVNCPDIKKAGALLEAAGKAGLKHSGIISLKKFTVEIRGNERLETLLVPELDDSYLKKLVNEANARLKRTKENMRKLEKIIRED